MNKSLPNEILTHTFLNASEQVLYSVHRSSSIEREIVSSPFFWRRKFEKEGLLLLTEGVGFASWLSIYKLACFSRNFAKDLMESNVQPIIRDSNSREQLRKSHPEVSTRVYLFGLKMDKIRDLKLLAFNKADPEQLMKFLTRGWKLGFDRDLSERRNKLSMRLSSYFANSVDRIKLSQVDRFLNDGRPAGNEPNFAFCEIYYCDLSSSFFFQMVIMNLELGENVEEYSFSISEAELRDFLTRITFFGISLDDY